MLPYPCGSHWHLGHASQRIEMAVAEKAAAFRARKRIDGRAA
jgi:hypothetical protein